MPSLRQSAPSRPSKKIIMTLHKEPEVKKLTAGRNTGSKGGTQMIMTKKWGFFLGIIGIPK
jgi:hypothetical protein